MHVQSGCYEHRPEVDRWEQVQSNSPSLSSSCFSLASPEPMFSFTSHVSTIQSCQKSWPPLCRRMSSFVRRLGILRAWGRPRSSCVDARLETNHYTADDSHGRCHRALDKTFSVSVKMKHGSLGIFLSSEGSTALWLENRETFILPARGLIKAQR